MWICRARRHDLGRYHPVTQAKNGRCVFDANNNLNLGCTCGFPAINPCLRQSDGLQNGRIRSVPGLTAGGTEACSVTDPEPVD